MFFYSWLVAKRLAELVVLFICVMLVPQTRVESLVVISAAFLWLNLRNQATGKEMMFFGFFQPTIQAIRYLLGVLDQVHAVDHSVLTSDFEGLQEHVGIGDDRVLSPEFQPFRRPVSMRELRLEVEQAWFDNFIRMRRHKNSVFIEAAGSMGRFSIVAYAFFRLA